jgi:FRG domain
VGPRQSEATERPKGMAEVRRLIYEGWDEFSATLRKELFGAEPFEEHRFLFRGMSNSSWSLVSSFDRLFPKIADRRGVSARLLAAFRESCVEHLATDGMTDDEVLAIGQHHGLPTRLLDWSTSPYIAAWFAMSEVLMRPPEPHQHVSVWALHRAAPIWDVESGVSIVTSSSAHNPRLRLQGGKFTRALMPFATLEEYVESMRHFDGVGLTQMSVPSSDAARGLAELQMMGITSHRLFPDLGGAAQSAVMSLRLRTAADSLRPA